MEKNTQNIPYFIKMRGCINCSASKTYKERYGNDYGFDHEIVAQCVLMGCVGEGHDLSNPFMDPEDVAKFALQKNNEDFTQNAKKYVERVKEKFGRFYEKLGVSLDNLFS